MPGNFLESLLSYGRETFGIASATTNDAAAQLQDRNLPELPFAQGTAPPSAPAPTVIDLSSPSPSKPLTSSMQHKHPSNNHREPRSQAYRSADERRLVGDYSTPADAVAAPDPLSWMPGMSSVHGNIPTKPTSSASWRPINTINDVNPRVGQGKPKTYGKHNHPYAAPIGKIRHAGQEAYILKHASSPTTPARSQSSRTERARTSGDASARKRRKVEPVIDLDSDEDTVSEKQEVLPLSASPTAVLSQSQSSNGSTRATTASKRLPQPESAFQSVDILGAAHRKKPRKAGSDRNQGTRGMSPFGGGNLSTQSAPIEIFDDDFVDQTKTPRQSIFQDFTQGDTSHSVHDETTSRHFPKMRVNESTLERPRAGRQAAGNTMELHKTFRQAPRKPVETDVSEDELAMSDPKETPRKLIKTPSKATQAANRAVKRKAQTNSPNRETRGGWPLLFARTHTYEHHCPEAKNDRHGLVLRIANEPWLVLEWDQNDSVYLTKLEINRKDFIKVQADDVRRIRLEGPRKQDGNFAILDLEFVNRSDHLAFRDQYAKLLAPKEKVVIKEEQAMQTVFSKALVLNDKVGTSELVHDSIFEKDDHYKQVQRVRKTPLLDFLNSKREGAKDLVTAAGKQSLVVTNPSARVSTRPARSTRSSMPNYHQDTSADERTVEKYSIVKGLGAPWVRPLEYARGRQRAVVHFDDLSRLDEEECLNDSLIDFYMIYLCDKLNVPSDKVYFFNTYFFTQLTKNTGRQSMNYKAVERWTSRIDVFAYDYIVVPINEATHWYLAIICNVSNIARKPLMEDFDDDLAVALEQSRREHANHTIIGDDQTETPPQVLLPQDNLESTVADPNETHDDDTNLFEEESKLDLVDPADMGNESQMEATSSQPLSVADPQSTQTSQVPQDGIGAEALPESILSKLTISPERKKTKRKHTFPKKDPTQPIILILDSLSQTRSGTVRSLKDWLAAEGEAKRGMEVIIKEKGYYPKASQIPMQNNWTDCGVYLLGYVEKFFQDPDQFKIKLLTGEMSATEDWPELKPVEMRDNMRRIIFKLAGDQKVARKAEKKLKVEAAKVKVSPTPPENEPAKPEIKESQSEQIPSETSANHNVTSHTEAQATQPKPCDLEAAPTEAPKSRLASPFNPQIQSAQKATIERDAEVVREKSGSPVPIPEFSTPVTKQAKRRKSPEVRITMTPSRMGSAQNGERRSSKAAHDGGHARPSQNTSVSLSPSKRRRVREDDDTLRIPPPKKPFVQSSPVKQKIRGYDASQPITIEDSQEDKSPANLTATQKTGLPAQRLPPKTSSPVVRVFHSYPSTQMTTAPNPKFTGEAHGQHEDTFAGRELEARLREADEERNKPRQSGAASLPTTSIYREKKKEICERMVIDIHDGDDTWAQKFSREVSETPEPESRRAA